MARIQVNEANIKAYIKKFDVVGDRSLLLSGLENLSSNVYKKVWDALLNQELFLDEFIRVKNFNDEGFIELLKETTLRWDLDLGDKKTSTLTYKHIFNDLNLSDNSLNLSEVTKAELVINPYVGISYTTGLNGQWITKQALLDAWDILFHRMFLEFNSFNIDSVADITWREQHDETLPLRPDENFSYILKNEDRLNLGTPNNEDWVNTIGNILFNPILMDSTEKDTDIINREFLEKFVSIDGSSSPVSSSYAFSRFLLKGLRPEPFQRLILVQLAFILGEDKVYNQTEEDREKFETDVKKILSIVDLTANPITYNNYLDEIPILKGRWKLRFRPEEGQDIAERIDFWNAERNLITQLTILKLFKAIFDLTPNNNTSTYFSNNPPTDDFIKLRELLNERIEDINLILDYRDLLRSFWWRCVEIARETIFGTYPLDDLVRENIKVNFNED